MDVEGNFTYTPNQNYVGIDYFTYTIEDADGQQDSAIVWLNLTDVPEPPPPPPPPEPEPGRWFIAQADNHDQQIDPDKSIDEGNDWTFTVVYGGGGNTPIALGQQVIVTLDTWIPGQADEASLTDYTLDMNGIGQFDVVDYVYENDQWVVTIEANNDGANLTGNVFNVTVYAETDEEVEVSELIGFDIDTAELDGNPIGSVWETNDDVLVEIVDNTEPPPPPPPPEDPLPPDAIDNNYETDEDEPVLGNVFTDFTGEGLDNDPDSTFALKDYTQAFNGSVVVNPDGSFTYTPNEGYFGNDSFEYTIIDPDGLEDTATVYITVNEVPEPPPPPPPEPPVFEGQWFISQADNHDQGIDPDKTIIEGDKKDGEWDFNVIYQGGGNVHIDADQSVFVTLDLWVPEGADQATYLDDYTINVHGLSQIDVKSWELNGSKLTVEVGTDKANGANLTGNVFRVEVFATDDEAVEGPELIGFDIDDAVGADGAIYGQAWETNDDVLIEIESDDLGSLVDPGDDIV
jgi:hypothetical protein